MLREILHVFYPRTCAACQLPLSTAEDRICSGCLLELPYTGYRLTSANPVMELFRGRIPVQGAASYLYFDKESRVQNVMHQLKYGEDPFLARKMGRMMGAFYRRTDPGLSRVLIPVPLHPRKMRTRGYNQSEEIALGMAEQTGWKVESNALMKVRHTASQTRKSRWMRWENVEQVFELALPDRVEGQEVVLVDDVLTTGSTLEACGWSVYTGNPSALFIVTLACALK